MQMYPNDHFTNNYNHHDNVPAVHMMKPDHHSLHHGHNPNRGNSYGYGGYNSHEKHGNSYRYDEHHATEHELYQAMQQKDRRMKHAHSALGGNMHHSGGMKHGGEYGYEAHQGHYGPHKEFKFCHYPPEEKKKDHFWGFKGIVN